jgi:hypothetical protein
MIAKIASELGTIAQDVRRRGTTNSLKVGMRITLTLWMINGDPKSFPPAIRNPHGVPLSVRSIFALNLVTDILANDPTLFRTVQRTTTIQ